MKAPRSISHEFVDSVPSVREEGKLYVSLRFRTAIHSCFCGCGRKVVTPIRPTAWRFAFDGETVSLRPSVGNWSFPCRSHYVIENGVAIPAGDMTTEQIQAGRRRDRVLQNRHYGKPPAIPSAEPVARKKRRTFWQWLTGRKRV